MSRRFIQITCFALFGFLGFGAGSTSAGQKPIGTTGQGSAAAGSKRRVYVLHSGVHTILAGPTNNHFAHTMRDALKKRGIAERDLVVLDNPFPPASWHNMFPLECLTTFMASARPDSRVSLDAYLRLDRVLQTHGVSADDDLVWIGHSAGGQMGLTMAFLAHYAGRFPELIDTAPYRFDMVITLGSPIASHYLPAHVKVRHYLSPKDKIPRRIAKYSPPLLWLFGYDLPIKPLPPVLTPASKIRVFSDVPHPGWDNDRVVDRILAETNPHHRPAWHLPCGWPSPRLALVQFLCLALDEFCHISVEDPPRLK